jgi:hypothetical protein
MRVDIRPQWRKLAAWYWDTFDSRGTGADGGMSIWELLQRDYGAIKVFSITNIHEEKGMWVKFPDEKSYVAFVLRWS